MVKDFDETIAFQEIDEQIGNSNVLSTHSKDLIQARNIKKQKQILTQIDNKIVQNLGQDAL